MDRTVTNIIKFVCCNLIFFHHFYILDIGVCTWGRIACSVFFFLSAYGICKSLQKNKYGLVTFIWTRLSRVFIPYIMVNLLAVGIVPFLLTGKEGIPIFQLVNHDIALKVGSSVTEWISYLVGLKKIDGATWFLDVLFISYVFIWLTEKIHRQKVRIVAIVFVPAIMLVSDRLLQTHICLWPTDVVGIIAGLLFVEFESNVTSYTLKHYSIVLSASLSLLGVFVALYIAWQAKGTVPWRYMEMVMLLFSCFAVASTACLALKFRCQHTRCWTLLGGVSFLFYLVHIKVIDVLAEYDVRPLVIWSFVGTFIVSYLLFILDNQIQNRLWRKR